MRKTAKMLKNEHFFLFISCFSFVLAYFYSSFVLEREQDADEYAYSVMGETFYDALREQERKFSKDAETETDLTFMMDLAENHLRAEHIAQIIIKERS